jgi:hypothetical protein
MRAKVRLVKSSSLRQNFAGLATFSLLAQLAVHGKTLSLTVLMAVLVGNPGRGE